MHGLDELGLQLHVNWIRVWSRAFWCSKSTRCSAGTLSIPRLGGCCRFVQGPGTTAQDSVVPKWFSGALASNLLLCRLAGTWAHRDFVSSWNHWQHFQKLCPFKWTQCGVSSCSVLFQLSRQINLTCKVVKSYGGKSSDKNSFLFLLSSQKLRLDDVSIWQKFPLVNRKECKCPTWGSKPRPTSHQTKFTSKISFPNLIFQFLFTNEHIGDQCPLEAINTLKTCHKILTNETWMCEEV